MAKVRVWAAAAGLMTAVASAPASAQQQGAGAKGCAELFGRPGIVWRGAGGQMTLKQLASYAAPVFWLSPDEPTLDRKRGRDVRVPAPFPFEPSAAGPVAYYQLTELTELSGTTGAFQANASDKGQSVVDLDKILSLRIKFIAYFPNEAGVGQHTHDVEPTEFRMLVGRANGTLARSAGYQCDDPSYLIIVTRVTGEAHGNPWYYNVLLPDRETVLPIHLLVEEGKHATATDKNADGYFTPGYDVSVRMNDAWGVRDTIRGGTLYSGKFEAWMAKVRKPEHRVLPPLPADSPLRPGLMGEVDADNDAVYELRAYPASSLATTDALLKHKIAEKETPNWPVIHSSSRGLTPVIDTLEEGRELKPFSVSYRNDGQPGLAIAFPLLVFKNVHEPLTGGYLVNRMYFKDEKLHDWGWMMMYTPSASRWFDQYLAGGIETDRHTNQGMADTTTRDFVLETGIKLRFRAPNRVFGAITNFWGFRAGIKNTGWFDIEHLSYVIEVGAGVW